MNGSTYRDNQGRLLFVSAGISDGTIWGTYFRKPTGSLKRVCSPSLPLWLCRDDAEKDLLFYALERGFKEVLKT